MKNSKIIKVITIAFVAILAITILPIKALAVDVYPGGLSIPVGGNASFNVAGSGAAGMFSVSSEGPIVASVNGSPWIDYDTSVSVTVTGIAPGYGIVYVYLDDVTTRDQQDISGQCLTVAVTVYEPQDNPDAGTGGEDYDYSNPGDGSSDTSLSKLEVEGYKLKDEGHDIYSCSVPNNVEKVNIIAEATDENSTVTGAGEHKLNPGLNEIDITVEAENGFSKSYRIKITRRDNTYTLADLKKEISNIKDKIIIVKLADNDKLDKELLDAIKKAKKTIQLCKYDQDTLVYTWTIIGENITGMDSFDPSVTFESANKTTIEKLMNYASGMILNFAYHGKLPKGTKFNLNVSKTYKDKDILYLYYFDKEKNTIMPEGKEIIVKDGMAEIELTHCSEYFLTQAAPVKAANSNSKAFIIIIIIETLIIIGLAIFIIISESKKRRVKRNVYEEPEKEEIDIQFVGEQTTDERTTDEKPTNE